MVADNVCSRPVHIHRCINIIYIFRITLYVSIPGAGDGACDGIAVGRYTIGQDDDVLQIAYGRIRVQQLLGHMDTGLLVGAAAGFDAIDLTLKSIQLIGGIEMTVVDARSGFGVSDNGDAGSTALRQQLLAKGNGSLFGIQKFVVIVHTARFVDDQDHVGVGLEVLALDGQGDLVDALLVLYRLGHLVEQDGSRSFP